MMDSLVRATAGSGRMRQVAHAIDGSPSVAGSSMSAGTSAELRGLVEAEIVPRLLSAHAMRTRPAATRRPPPPLSRLLHEQDVSDFAALSISSDVAAATRFVEERCRVGIPLDVLYLDLLSPAARTLGTMWERDMCSFADVTVGLGVVQGVLHALSDRFVDGTSGGADPRHSALLVGAPGEQHSVGVHMVAEFFLRAGWAVRSEHPTSVGACAELASEAWYGVVGISAGSSVKIDTVIECVRLVRMRSANRDAAILVGGPLFVIHPECAQAVGADGTATDGSQVPQLAEKFVARMPVRA